MRSLILLPWTLLRVFLQSIVLAMGQIRMRLGRSILTTLGIVIGIASTVAVVAGLTGLREKVLADMSLIGVNRIGIWAQRPESGPLKRAAWNRIEFRPGQVEGLLEQCPSTDALTRLTGMRGVVRYQAASFEKNDIYGVDPSWHETENLAVIEGRPFNQIDMERGANVCIICPNTRKILNLPRDCIGERIYISSVPYRIVGVTEPIFAFAALPINLEDATIVLVPFTAVYNSGEWMAAQVNSRSPEVIEDAMAELRFFLRIMRGVRPGDPDNFGMESVGQMIETFNGIAAAITGVAGSIVAISLLVGGIGIMNIMLVSVSERTREIGLRKAVGARPVTIVFQFLVEAVILCLVGGAIGVALGQGLVTGLGALVGGAFEGLTVPLWAVALAFGFSTAVGLFFGIVPAIKAARLDPIEALRRA